MRTEESSSSPVGVLIYCCSLSRLSQAACVDMLIKSQCIVCEGFHCKCIDPWLTEKRNTCPLCKDVVGRRHGNAAAATDETQPLLDAQDESESTPVNSAGNICSVFKGFLQ